MGVQLRECDFIRQSFSLSSHFVSATVLEKLGLLGVVMLLLWLDFDGVKAKHSFQIVPSHYSSGDITLAVKARHNSSFSFFITDPH